MHGLIHLKVYTQTVFILVETKRKNAFRYFYVISLQFLDH